MTVLMSRTERALSTTESLCPVCLKRLPATYVATENQVLLEKTCSEHGSFRTKVWAGEPNFETWVRPKLPSLMTNPFTEVKHGCPYDCGLCSMHHQHTCTAVIEVTNRCNLHCAFCFADAGGLSKDPSLEQIQMWYKSVLDSGGPCNVQISGGEPTLRKDLPDIIALGRSMGFEFIQLNTNGIRLSRDDSLLPKLKEAGLSSIFLQFDGTDDAIYKHLRGVQLLPDKLRVIEQCRDVGVGVVLVPTVVAGVNDEVLGEIISFALEHMPTIRGVHFQPASYFGRVPQTPKTSNRITLPEVIQGIEKQTNHRMKIENFRPAGCENAMCSFHGNFILLEDGSLQSTTRHEAQELCCVPIERAEVGSRKAKAFVASHWQPVELDRNMSGQMGCTDEDSLSRFLRRAKSHTLTVSGMAFQDAWNVDVNRLRDCCIHTVDPTGRLIPFCAYNLTDTQGNALYRNCARRSVEESS